MHFVVLAPIHFDADNQDLCDSINQYRSTTRTTSCARSKNKSMSLLQAPFESQPCVEHLDVVVPLVAKDSSFALRAVPTCAGCVRKSPVSRLCPLNIVTSMMTMMHPSF